jgi:hypothetical protein
VCPTRAQTTTDETWWLEKVQKVRPQRRANWHKIFQTDRWRMKAFWKFPLSVLEELNERFSRRLWAFPEIGFGDPRLPRVLRAG